MPDCLDCWIASQPGLLDLDCYYNINTWSDLSSTIQKKPNQSINVTFLRNGKESSIDIYTTFRVFPVDGKLDTLGMIGIAPEFIYEPIGLIKASQLGAVSTMGGLGLVVLSIKLLKVLPFKFFL